MPFNLGAPELLLVLVILILLFGVGRISKIAGELGKGIRSFREGLNAATTLDEPTEQENKTS